MTAVAPGIFEHFGGNIAGEGAGGLGMAVLRPDGDRGATRERRKARDQGCGRADQKVGGRRELPRPGDDSPKLAGGLLQAVHFPVACNEGRVRHGWSGPSVRQASG
jgi:hypothetical protein